MVTEGRERDLTTLCSQDALFVIPRTAQRSGTKTVRGRFVDDIKNDRVKSRFVAAEVARDVRHDVHAGTPALKALRMIVSPAATQDGKHRPRSIVFYDVTAAFVHASIDEVVGVIPQDGLQEKGECFLLLGALYGSRIASKAVAATLHESAQNAQMDSEQSNSWFLPSPKSCWNVWMSRRRFHG